jgi:hypothetical protein
MPCRNGSELSSPDGSFFSPTGARGIIHVHERFKLNNLLNAEFDWEKTAANGFMQVHANVKCPNFGHLEIDVSALYLIAAPKTPEPVRTDAPELGERHRRPTVIIPVRSLRYHYVR